MASAGRTPGRCVAGPDPRGIERGPGARTGTPVTAVPAAVSTAPGRPQAPRDAVVGTPFPDLLADRASGLAGARQLPAPDDRLEHQVDGREGEQLPVEVREDLLGAPHKPGHDVGQEPAEDVDQSGSDLVELHGRPRPPVASGIVPTPTGNGQDPVPRVEPRP